MKQLEQAPADPCGPEKEEAGREDGRMDENPPPVSLDIISEYSKGPKLVYLPLFLKL